MRYVTALPGLFQPPVDRVLRVAEWQRIGDLTEDEIDFVMDVYNVAHGAVPTVFNQYSPGVQFRARHHARGQGWDEMWDPYPFRQVMDQFIERQRELYKLLDPEILASVPGKSPLVKAVRLLKLLRLMEMFRVRYLTLIARLSAAFQVISQLDGGALTVFNTLLGLQAGDGVQEQMALELAVRNDLTLTEMIRVSQELDEISELNVRKDTALLPDANGEDVQMRPIERLGEISRASKSAWGLPRNLMYYQAVTGQLQVREPVTRKSKKRAEYILLDASGSMNMYNRAPIGRAAGVIMHRLKAVRDGDAELWLQRFNADTYGEEYHADSPESARALMEKMLDPSFYGGGGTDFARPLTKAGTRASELVASGKLRSAELVIVTDGEADVPSLEALRGIKLHAVQVGNQEALELKKLAVASGGVNLFVGDQ